MPLMGGGILESTSWPGLQDILTSTSQVGMHSAKYSVIRLEHGPQESGGGGGVKTQHLCVLLLYLPSQGIEAMPNDRVVEICCLAEGTG